MAEGEEKTVGYDTLSRSDAHGIQRREPDGRGQRGAIQYAAGFVGLLGIVVVLTASGGGDVWRQKADLLLARAAEAKTVLAGHPSTGPTGSASSIKTQQLLEILQTSNSFESSNIKAQNLTFELNDSSVPVEPHQVDFDIMLIGLLTLAATYVVMGYAWLNVPNSDELVYLIILATAFNQSVFAMSVGKHSAKLSWNEVVFWTSVSRFLIALPLLITEQFPEVLCCLRSSPPPPPPLRDSVDDEWGRRNSEGSSHCADIEQEEEQQFSVLCCLVPFGVMSAIMLSLRNLMSVMCGNITINYGLSHLPMATVASLDASSSFFAALFGAIFLKEYLSCAITSFVFLGFVGIVLVFQPLELIGLDDTSSNLSPMQVFASLVVLLGSAGQGLQSVLQRGWKWSVWLGICTAGLTGMIFTLAIDHFIMTDRDSCWEWVREESSTSPLTTFAWVLILCLTSFNKSLCMNYVLKEASSGVSAGTMQTVYTCAVVAFQVCLQILFFDVEMSTCSWVGVAVIVISCVGIVHCEAMQNQAKADAAAYQPIQDYKDSALPSERSAAQPVTGREAGTMNLKNVGIGTPRSTRSDATPRSSASQLLSHRTSKSVRFSGVYTPRSEDRNTPRIEAQCGL